jgi:hypothetical protein
MWEELKVYKQLEKKDINSTFKKFGAEILSYLNNYSVDQTSSILKLFRLTNQLEQAIFIERSSGSYNLEIRVCIKPFDFYRRHKFTMINIVPLGDIMNNYRRSFYPLTQEWKDLAIYLVAKIKDEIEQYFERYNSYEKIIEKRREIEPQDFGLDNKYELLIYAAIKMQNKTLFNFYIDKKLSRPVMHISKCEYLKPDIPEINEVAFLQRIKELAHTSDFESIENEIKKVNRMD